MDLKPFKLDIDELINEFVKGGSPTFAEMKRVWASKKFSYIFEASPSKDQACFIQSLYAYCSGYMVSTNSLLSRLGGLYCLYCLYETAIQASFQDLYISGLFANSRIEHFTHLDMELELEVDLFKQKSAEYARAKEQAIKGASDIVDVENIKHITENQTLIGDVVGKTADDWKAQKELYYEKTGIRHQPVKDSVNVVGEEQEKSQQEVAEEQDDNEDFSKELEEVLLSAQNDSDFEEKNQKRHGEQQKSTDTSIDTNELLQNGKWLSVRE